MVDGGYAQRARSLLSSGASLPASRDAVRPLIDALPASGGGMTRTPTSDLDLERQRSCAVNGDLWAATLKELAPVDELGAYMWVAFACQRDIDARPVESISSSSRPRRSKIRRSSR